MYLSIASYRDPLLQSTIDDAFSKAAYPEEIEVGCFIQAFPEDIDCLVTNDYGGKVKWSVTTPGEVFSVTACRSRANQWLSDRHEYCLQIDSHTRFITYWDDSLIADYESFAIDTALFSSYLPGWVPKESADKIFPQSQSDYLLPVFDEIFSKKTFFDHYELVPKLELLQRNPGTTVRSWYLAGHFIFGPSTYFLSVKQPPWILFWGEEVYNSLVAFTNGWDVFVPPTLPLRHMYPQDVPHLSLNKLWKDFPYRWASTMRSSTDMVIDAIAGRTVGDEHLGGIRALDDLYTFIGYDLGTTFTRWRDEYRTTLH